MYSQRHGSTLIFYRRVEEVVSRRDAWVHACMHACARVFMSEHVKGNRAGSLNERLRETTNGAEFSSC